MTKIGFKISPTSEDGVWWIRGGWYETSAFLQHSKTLKRNRLKLASYRQRDSRGLIDYSTDFLWNLNTIILFGKANFNLSWTWSKSSLQVFLVLSNNVNEVLIFYLTIIFLKFNIFLHNSLSKWRFTSKVIKIFPFKNQNHKLIITPAKVLY